MALRLARVTSNEELAKKVNAALIKGIPRLGGKVVVPLRL